MLDTIFKPFVEQSPVCVMAVAAVRRLLGRDRLDRLFDRARVGQYVHRLMFADLFDLMAAVVSGSRRSVHHAYQESALGVSVVAVYDKLKGVEPSVCQSLVRETAAEVATLMAEMDAAAGHAGRRAPVLPGHRTKVLDGNCVAATEHRIGPLRGTSAGPLPGKSLVVLDADRRLIADLFTCVDGHAQERAILPQVYPTVAAGDLWVADRNFCTAEFLSELSARGACFVIRRHGNMAVRPAGDRVRVGRCDTGTVYERPVVATTPGGGDLPLRMVEVELDHPTRDGDPVLTVLTNLPASVGAVAVADIYRGRWAIETAFQELAAHFNSEIATLGYPAAALFAFAVAVTLYNALALMRAALAVHHGATPVDEDVSGYYIAAELATTTRGMLIAIPPAHWDPFEQMPAAAFAAEIVALAGAVNLSHFKKHPRGPKLPQPPRVHDPASPHVSTHRLIEARKAKRKQATRP
jgi:IS4 transposase